VGRGSVLAAGAAHAVAAHAVAFAQRRDAQTARHAPPDGAARAATSTCSGVVGGCVRVGVGVISACTRYGAANAAKRAQVT
jgi:hypothetical protein